MSARRLVKNSAVCALEQARSPPHLRRPDIHAELRRLGRRVNRKRIARVMRERGIRGVTRRKHRSLTRPDKKAKPAPDLIGRDFHADTPGTKPVGDITYLPTAEGRLHLARRLDLATREAVGYAMADHHRAELVVDALDMAHGRGYLQPRRVIHSDRGSEYTPAQFRTYSCTACGAVSPRGKNSARVMLVRAGLNPAGADRGRPGGTQPRLAA